DYNAVRWSNNIVHKTPSHQYVDMIEADGVAAKSVRDGGDAFPGTAAMSRLDLKWWNGKSTGISLRGISDADGNVTFRAVAPVAAPTDFYTVEQVLATKDGADVADASVCGYIVGYARSGTYSNRTAVFSSGMSRTNVLIADSPDETEWCNCIPVMLVADSDARLDLNLYDHPEMRGVYVKVSGLITDVNSYRGVKDCSQYEILSNNSIGEVEVTDADAEWYTLQGVRVDSPSSPGVYIMRTSSGSKKVIF
ncbi:MAG: hypothetical protein K2G59_02135, partial [Muribaculaceae bacterium]|nr:hypothetical protein [Muribaculaceae bacterium]